MVINFIIAQLVICFSPALLIPSLLLNIDGMGMLLAQWFILLGVEWLTFQIHMAYSTNEAGIMPSVSKSFNELISSFNRKITAMAFCAEQSNIIFLTVRFPILHVKEAIPERHLTSSTDKAGCVPSLS